MKNISQEQKAVIYGQLLNEHTRLHNRINEIKSQNIEQSPREIQEIRNLEMAQRKIFTQINKLLS